MKQKLVHFTIAKSRLTIILTLVSLTTVIITGCSTNPRSKVYYETAKSRTGLVNDHYQVISQIDEKDAQIVHQNDDLKKGAMFAQRGNVIKGTNKNGNFYFYKIGIDAWRDNISKADFITKLPNYEKLLDEFLSDVEEMYIGSKGRVVSLHRLYGQTGETTNAEAEIGSVFFKDVGIFQEDDMITFYYSDIDKSEFIFHRNTTAPKALTDGTQFKSVFTSKETPGILLVNEPRSVFSFYMPVKKEGFSYLATIVIEDTLYSMKGGKMKHVRLDEDYVVKTSFMMPSKNFICADLTQAYYNNRIKQGLEVTKTVVLAAIQAFTSYSTTTLSGNGYTYGGGSGSVAYQFSGRATTYDYSYIGDRASDLLNIVISGEASVADIKHEMSKYNCM